MSERWVVCEYNEDERFVRIIGSPSRPFMYSKDMALDIAQQVSRAPGRETYRAERASQREAEIMYHHIMGNGYIINE